MLRSSTSVVRSLKYVFIRKETIITLQARKKICRGMILGQNDLKPPLTGERRKKLTKKFRAGRKQREEIERCLFPTLNCYNLILKTRLYEKITNVYKKTTFLDQK
jgi:hypothetical protein